MFIEREEEEEPLQGTEWRDHHSLMSLHFRSFMRLGDLGTDFAACNGSGKCSEILRPQLSCTEKNDWNCPLDIYFSSLLSWAPFKHHSAECSEKCAYRIKQAKYERLSPFLQMDHRWVQGLGDWAVEAKSVVQQLKVKKVTGWCSRQRRYLG